VRSKRFWINRLLLRLLRPETLALVGFWLIIVGLVVEAATIILMPSGTWEKIVSAICTLIIAVGVWWEEIAAGESKAPRHLLPEQQQRISARMAPFKGLCAGLGAVPPSRANTDFLNQLLAVLKAPMLDPCCGCVRSSIGVARVIAA
jgi:hypothetical protein